MSFNTAVSLKEVLTFTAFTYNPRSKQTRSVFPMAKPCYRFLLKRRWKKWHKRNSLAV